MSSPQGLDPWSALSLERGTTDPATIRRAYAAALRAHPPEDDPAGFRRVRDAYEFLTRADPDFLRALALGEARGLDDSTGFPSAQGPSARPHGGSSPPLAGSGRPDTTESVATVEAGWAAAIDAALAVPDARARALALRAAVGEAVVRAAARGSRGQAALARALASTTDAHQTLLVARCIPARALTAALEAGDGALVGWTLDALLRCGDVEVVGALACEVSATLHEVSPDAVLGGLIPLARAAAIPAPEGARRLLDRAWEAAPPADRNRLPTEVVDCAIRAAREVRDWPAVEQAFLARLVLLGGSEAPSTGTTPGLLRARLAGMPADSRVRALVQALDPALVPAASAPARHAAQDRTSASRTSTTSTKVWLSLVVFMLLVVARMLGLGGGRSSGTRTTRPVPEHPPSSPAPSDEPEPLTIPERSRLRDLEGRRLGPGGLNPDENEELSALRRRAARHPTREEGPGHDPGPLEEPDMRPLDRWEREELNRLEVRLVHGDPLSQSERLRMRALQARERAARHAPR